jgi:AcrR family transcriptional regulator
LTAAPVRFTVRHINSRTGTSKGYHSPLREEQAAATRARILDALLELLREDGNHLVTLAMETVAARAGVSKPTLYRHFPNKASLFGALAEASYDRVSANVGPVSLEGLDAILPRVFRAMDEREPIMRALLATDVGRQARAGRRSQRLSIVTELLGPATAGIDDETRRRLEAVTLLLTSSAAYLYLKDNGFGTDEAAHAATWAVLALVEKAGESRGAR